MCHFSVKRPSSYSFLSFVEGCPYRSVEFVFPIENDPKQPHSISRLILFLLNNYNKVTMY